MSEIGFLDLFCGIGGLSIGLERAGLRCLGGLDNWPLAVETFKRNHGGKPVLCADITKLTPAEALANLGIQRAQIRGVVGGPPCQGFSTVGKRWEDDPRNSLWAHFLGFVDHIRPEFVLIENVEGLAVMGRGEFPRAITAALERLGYDVTWEVLRSANYGVPQLRKRFVLVALSGEVGADPSLPPATHQETPSLFAPEAWVTVADAISDLPPLASGQRIEVYAEPPKTSYQRGLRAGWEILMHHEAARHPPELVKVLSFIPDGGNRKSIPDEFQPRSGFHNSYARLASWRPAVAVTSNMRKPSSARATHPSQNRGLTVREGLRLQSFPDSFALAGSRTDQYLQVGNAVPPLLGQALGRHLRGLLDRGYALKEAV